MQTDYDICVIGGGAAGLVVAAGGAKLGAKVALVETRALGGDCLHYGCVPSKTLLHAAKVAQTMRDAAQTGLPPHVPEISLAHVMEHVQDVIDQIKPNDSPERFRGLGVEVIFGAGHFIDRYTFKINDRLLKARRFVLATGSRPMVPAVPGLESIPFLTNESVFDLREPVPHLLILGAGPIGMEMAQAFRRFRSQVTVIDIGQQALPREDTDLVGVVEGRLKSEGVKFYLGHRTRRAEGNAGDIALTVESREGHETLLHGTHLLIATGRAPNVEQLGLEAAGVGQENGRLKLDARLRTTNRRIFACGDLAGPYLFTHMAEHQAGVVLRNALFHLPARAQTKKVPWCTFTDPELARVGMSETEAASAGISHRVYRFPFSDIDRAVTDVDTAGFAKVIADRRGRLLGAALVGAHAGELIHEYALALSKKMKIGDLAGVIHIYPTRAQINRRVAEQRAKEALTPSRRRWLQRLFGLRGGKAATELPVTEVARAPARD
ncbi:MAG: FAD-dependent oxidoreductase [Sulfuricaulis sp.]|uniref:NAD(P)/FAD-dependent oxidoreductase n=1 Tax=Sulfuricaulis sp. TaxID=2003553 RepID=UPI0034A4DED9